MMDSELGKIPEGWEVKRLNEIIDIFSGFAFKSGTFEKDARYGLVTIKNVQAGLFVDKCQSYIKELPKKMPDYCFLSNGDMLLSLTGNVGRVCLVYGTDYILNQRVAKIVPKEVDNKAFVYCLFLQSEFRLKLEKISTGVAQQNLSPIEMGKIKVIVPKEEVLRQFGYTCNPMLEEIALMFRKNAILRETRDVLLPKLNSGEIDVEHLDIKTEDIE
jgi:type I restriction enzyme S subunit